jgi:hypothetical protein
VQAIIRAICLTILIIAGWEQSEAQQRMVKEIPYRILSAGKAYGSLDIIGYGVSVDSFLDRQQIEDLICQIIRKEKPPSSEILDVGIFYKLNEIFNPGISRELQSQLIDQYIAAYRWHKGIPGVRKRLWIYRDSIGNSLGPKAYAFDHTSACDQLKQ